MIMLSLKKDSFISPFPIWIPFPPFSCLSEVTRPLVQCWIEQWKQTSLPALDLREKLYLLPLYWDELCASKPHMSESLAPGPLNATGFRDRVLKGTGKVKWGHMGGPYSTMTGIFRRRGDYVTDMYKYRGKTIWRQREDHL